MTATSLPTAPDTTPLWGPLVGAFAITPNDNANLARVTRSVYVGGSGNLVVTLYDGSIVTLSGVPGGTLLPVRAIKVATASTATNIVGLY